LDLIALAVAVGVSLGMAVLGTVLAGDSLKTWYPTIRHPRFEPPLWGFVLVGLIVYVIDAIVLYRLLAVVEDSGIRLAAIVALLVVMLGNELWNALLFRLRSPYAAVIGLVGFIGLLGVLVVTLFLADAISSWLMLAYLAWVVGFDVPWTVRLWQLNRLPGQTE
jgi:tryptophan-rich sensory protein